jgi:hypothetical protein
MKTQSAVKPSDFSVRKRDKGQAYIRLRKNIEEFTTEEGDTLYSYDEVEVQIASRRNLEQYIESHFDELYTLAGQQEQQRKDEKQVAEAYEFLRKSDYIPQKYGDKIIEGEDTTGFLDSFSEQLNMTYRDALTKREKMREVIRTKEA